MFSEFDLFLGIIVSLSIIFGSIFTWKKTNLKFFIKKIYIKYFPEKFNIGVSIKYNENKDSEIYTKALVNELNNKIKEYDVKNLFKIKNLSKIIEDEKDFTTDFINKKQIDLVIFGEYSQDGLKKEGKNHYNFRWRYRFNTFISKNKGFDITDYMNSVFYEAYPNENFEFFSDDSYIRIKDFSNILSEFSLFLIGVNLPNFHKFEKSLCILENLYNSTKNITLKEKIKNNILGIIYFNIQYNYEFFYKNEKFIELNIPLYEKSLIYDQNDLFNCINLSTCYYRKKNIEKARFYTDKSYKLDPKNIMAIINKAFFSIIDRNYKLALTLYKKTRNSNNNSMATDLCSFLEEEYEKLKEIALLFSMGFAYYYYLENREVSYEKFLEFVKLSENKDDYKHMNRYAKKLLEKNQIDF